MRLTFAILPTLLICLSVPAAGVFAQEAPPPPPTFAPSKENPLSSWNKLMYGQVKFIVARSADKMPEENYGFKPAEAVRSYGQIVGHIADSQYRFCSIVLGEKNPAPKIEQTKTSKADLAAALKEAFACCDRAYDGMTDATAVQMVRMFTTDAPRLGVLEVNTTHTTEHYGNLVTYMRMKNIVPPTSEPGFMTRPSPKQ